MMTNPATGPANEEQDQKSQVQSGRYSTHVQDALRHNLHQLERLAFFYHKRGQVEQAQQIYTTMLEIRDGLEADVPQAKEA